MATYQELQEENAALRRQVAALQAQVAPNTLPPQETVPQNDASQWSIFDHMLEGVQILGFDWRYLYLNAEAQRHNHRPNAELLGKVYMDMWPGIQATEVFARIRDCMEERLACQMENEFVFPNGTVRWFELSIQPISQGVFIFSVDITERKGSEAQRSKLMERLDLATRAARMGIWDWDIQKNELVWEEEMYPLYGLRHGEFQGAYEAWLNGLHPDDRTFSNEISAQAVRGEREYDTEFRVLWPDGSVHWLKANGQVFRDEAGRPVRMVGVNYDITERKRMEEGLRRRTEELEQLLNMLPEAIWISEDAECKLIRGNHFANELLGVAEKANVSQSSSASEVRLRQFTQGHELAPDELPMQMAARSGQPQLDIELRLERTGRSVHFLLGGAVPLFDAGGKVRGVVAAFHDITERKHAEERFMKSFASNPVGMDILHLADGRVVEVNQAYLSITGLRRAEIIGKTSVEAGLISDAAQWQHALNSLREKGSLPQCEIEFRRRNGETGYAIVSGETIEIGEERYALVSTNDITARKQAENELRCTLEELKRSNAELEQFAYVASHDLQEPLRAVAGMVSLLQQRYKGKLDARADEYIFHAVDAAGRMQALIADLLAYSRVDRHGKPFEMVDAGECLQVALQNLEIAIGESQASVTWDDLPHVFADCPQLAQLFQNLLGNALKFRGEREPQIHIGVAKMGNTWEFTVCDNGIGIEPQYFERIFLIFQRLHTRREYAGTGIGLALCKKIVERHGGTIWVKSQLGQGSTFHFTLPMRNTPL